MSDSDKNLYPHDFIKIDYPSENLPALDIFNKLYQLVFDYKWVGDKFLPKSSNHIIKTEHLSLLLAWPGILAMEIATLVGKKDYKNQLSSVRELLNSDVDYSRARAFFNDLIAPKPTSEELLKKIKELDISHDDFEISRLGNIMHKIIPELYTTISLLFNPGFIYKSIGLEMSFLSILLRNYYVICLMIADLIRKDKVEISEGSQHITFREIKELLDEMEIKKEFDIYFFSTLFSHIQTSKNNDAISEFFAKEEIKKGFRIHKTIDVPFLKLSLEKLDMGNDRFDNFAWIKRKVGPLEKKLKIENHGVAYDANPLSGKPVHIDYDLWYLLQNEITKGQESLNPTFLFLSNQKEGKLNLQYLLEALSLTAAQCSKTVGKFKEVWDEFLYNPDEIIKNNISDYINWISPIIKNCDTREQCLDFKYLSRIVKLHGTETNDAKFKKISKDIVEAEKNHIPKKLKEKLIQGVEELLDFVDFAISYFQGIGKESLLSEEETDKIKLLEFFDKHKSKYTYLCLLDHSIIEKIKFELRTEDNAIRDNITLTLVELNNLFGGATMTKNKLSVLLGFKSGESPKYEKWRDKSLKDIYPHVYTKKRKK